MKFFYLIFIVFMARFISCRKDDLGTTMDGDKEFLVGEWELTSSIFFDFCNDGEHYYLSAEEQNLIYRIIVEQDGYITFVQNDTIVEAGFIRFPEGGVEVTKTGTALDPKDYYYAIWIDGDRDRVFRCSGSLDSIRTNYTRRIGIYPEDCNVYRDYFRRK